MKICGHPGRAKHQRSGGFTDFTQSYQEFRDYISALTGLVNCTIISLIISLIGYTFKTMFPFILLKVFNPLTCTNARMWKKCKNDFCLFLQTEE